MTRRLAAATAVLAALAGCGGGGTSSERSGARSGGQVFADEGCGSCHVLAAAGASGRVGPSLDTRALPVAEVERWVRKGGTGMPAFGARLSARDVAAVSRYVARESLAARR